MSDRAVGGSCLCGSVQYEISGHLGLFQYCHCSRCRKFTGAAHSANLLVKPEQFRWLQGEELVGRYELPESRHFATGFCRRCGSSLPWLGKTGRAVVVPAGTLDEDPGIRPQYNIFCLSRPLWYRSAGELPEYDEMPPRDKPRKE